MSSTASSPELDSPSISHHRHLDTPKSVTAVHQTNFRVYGARKIWHELNRRGQSVARCT
ncbi:IS3 family transposase, partial [Kitasatospora sp. NPDC088346]|uniref:IS3 family transposase n=1 Tax=Kitasatospora sp. NPDC088346 TaxID=3364073 RepID=UPI00381EEA9A